MTATFTKGSKTYTEFKWGISKEEIISKLGTNYDIKFFEEENSLILSYRDIEYEGFNFKNVSFMITEDGLVSWTGIDVKGMYGLSPDRSFEKRIKKNYEDITKNKGIYLNSSGHYENTAMYTNSKLGSYIIKYNYKILDYSLKMIISNVTITKIRN